VLASSSLTKDARSCCTKTSFESIAKRVRFESKKIFQERPLLAQSGRSPAIYVRDGHRHVVADALPWTQGSLVRIPQGSAVSAIALEPIDHRFQYEAELLDNRDHVAVLVYKLGRDRCGDVFGQSANREDVSVV
jgi:hypothetical protein